MSSLLLRTVTARVNILNNNERKFPPIEGTLFLYCNIKLVRLVSKTTVVDRE